MSILDTLIADSSVPSRIPSSKEKTPPKSEKREQYEEDQRLARYQREEEEFQAIIAIRTRKETDD